jgi:hypothetical protein
MKVHSVLRGEYQNDADGYEPSININITFTDAEWDALLLSYDESSSTSPLATVCRPIVRAILAEAKDK